MASPSTLAADIDKDCVRVLKKQRSAGESALAGIDALLALVASARANAEAGMVEPAAEILSRLRLAHGAALASISLSSKECAVTSEGAKTASLTCSVGYPLLSPS